MKSGGGGYLPIHHACFYKLDNAPLQLIFDVAVEHGIIKKMLEAKDNDGWTCLHHACYAKLSTNSLRPLLEYSSKYADIPKMLEEKCNTGRTCFHEASFRDLSTDALRLFISFFPSKEIFEKVLAVKDSRNRKTAVDFADDAEVKQLLRDGKCFEQSRAWLLSNHQDTFLHSLFPNSFDKTCEALLELNNGLQHSQQHATIILIALMSSPVKFRQAVSKTDSSAPMSNYFDVVKQGDEKSTYNHWRKNISRCREFYGQWPPSERKTARKYEGEDSSSCVIQ